MGGRVFVSYSHDSPEHMARVLGLHERLRRLGFDCHIDQLEAGPAEGWRRWCKERVQTADFVLVVCTANYRERFDGKCDGAAIAPMIWNVRRPDGVLRSRLSRKLTKATP